MNKKLKKDLIKLAELQRNRTERKCKYCNILFRRGENFIIDQSIGDKEICSKCADKKGIVKI